MKRKGKKCERHCPKWFFYSENPGEEILERNFLQKKSLSLVFHRDTYQNCLL